MFPTKTKHDGNILINNLKILKKLVHGCGSGDKVDPEDPEPNKSPNASVLVEW